MSWTMWHVNGIGMQLNEVDPEKYRNFLVNHKKSLDGYEGCEKILDVCKNEDFDCSDLDEIQELTDVFTLSEPVAYIIDRETGIRFYSPGNNEDGDDTVLFSDMAPWEYNEREKTLKSAKEVEDVLKPYAEELGVEKSVGYFDLVYSG